MFLQPPAGPPVDLVDPGVLMGAVAGIAFFTVLSALGRSSVLAVVCRLSAIACALYPALAAWSWWSVADPTGTLAAAQTHQFRQLLGLSLSAPNLPDPGQLRGPTELEMLTLAWALALVGFWLVTSRAARSVR